MLEAFYLWLWTYWGVVTLGLVGGLVCRVIGYHVLEEYAFSGLFHLGQMTIVYTLVYSFMWALFGPISIHWIFFPIGSLSFLSFFIAFDPGFPSPRSYWEYDKEIALGSVLMLVVVIGSYVVTYADGVRARVVPDAVASRWAAQVTASPEEQERVDAEERVGGTGEGWIEVQGGSTRGGNEPGGGIERVAVRDYWPQEVSVAPGGYLTNGDGVALRVLASSYVVPLFDTARTEFPRGVMDVMKPYSAYYVLRQEGESLLLAEAPDVPLSQAYWARRGDCYVWPTGVSFLVTGEVAVFAHEQQAVELNDPLRPTDKYIDLGGIRNSGKEGSAETLDRFPVLRRSADLCAFLSPAQGGTLCWINLRQHGGSITWRNELNPQP